MDVWVLPPELKELSSGGIQASSGGMTLSKAYKFMRLMLRFAPKRF